MFIAPIHFLLVTRNVFQENPCSYFPRDKKEATQFVALWAVFWPFLEGETYAFVQPLRGSPGIQDASEMLGKDLAVTLASSINLHWHSPLGPMH